MSLTADLRSLGGLAPAHALLKMGWTYRALDYAVRQRWVQRIRNGWYALNEIDGLLAAAWRVGGLLTCVNAVSSFGMWSPPDDHLHVIVPPHDARMRRPDDRRIRLSDEPDDRVVLHWRDAEAHDRFRATPIECIVDLAACHAPQWVLGALDSGLSSRVLNRSDLRELRRRLPGERGEILSFVDPRSESFPESVLRWHLIRAGIPFLTQQWIDDMRVDFLLGRLVIEVDGKEHHDNSGAFERDRARDARLGIRGYRVLHFSYVQVVYRPDEVMASIRAALARGDHR
ncbi:endonuclease domain-containing protein [Protaetiibacter mangrovi]|uniref:Endonuclease domain-containing protein n=1 Tax=Protaetiibacter mangrovi TaxID=2970926 RepID=A0ABT1ZE54_9MICO|nr:endonuclease domain-containing protein [Protaetiibacter mangrovi]MCS0498999.1 endonuclease domain-containing protein [Protaetiibacter mangrovi]